MIVNQKYFNAIQQDSEDDTLTSEDIFRMFDEILIGLEQIEQRKISSRTIYLDAIEEILDAILLIFPYKLLDSKLLHHPLLHFLHQFFLNLLDKWRRSPLHINIQEMDMYLKIILFFVHIAEQTSLDKIQMKNLITMKRFLFKVREQIDEIVLNKLSLNDDRNIYALGLVTVTLLEDHPFFYKLGNNERLIRDLVINSLDSYNFNQVIDQLQNGQSLTDIERYLLYTCWQNLTSTSSIKQQQSIEIQSIDLIYSLSDKLLTRLEFTLDQSSPLTSTLFLYIFERFYQLLTINNLPTFDKHTHQLVERLTKILQTSSDDELTTATLKAFDKLVNNNIICSIIKPKHLTSVFNKYTSTKTNDEKCQLANNILAQIINEQDVEKNPTETMTIFINELKQLDPNGYNATVDKTLSNLKPLMQYEQIKSEFLKQNGLDILISFIRDGQLNKQSINQLEDVLNILWSCTFNNTQTIHKLQQDINLMTRVNHLLEIAKQDENNSLERAAEGLIWKVEKEEKFQQQQIEQAERRKQKAQEGESEDEEEQYDCMISYSWNDMNLVDRIFQHLTEKFGYKVWLDREQMHGSTIEAMANAVENAQFILLCMSETYKRSVHCQSEAEYAFNRKKHLVPLKMNADFEVDGWLGFILGSRLYIDFGKHDFEKAMELLHNEIQLQKKKRQTEKAMARQGNIEEISIRVDLILPNDYFRMENKDLAVESRTEKTTTTTTTDDSPNKIDSNKILTWNESMVIDFLRKKNLIDLIPLCQEMNGEELLNLYAMCKYSSATMYRSLKFELLNLHEKVLPISTFLHFINRLDTIIDHDVGSNKYIYRKHLSEHSSD